ncbi:MAG TPA: hypothetical protein VFH30_04330 [Acidimicrobiales bacterium]|nr:hypothetical protein [Acidimicrobiales bacterium]
MPGTELPSIGELPPVGEVPKRIRAQVIRQVDVFGNRVALVGAPEPGLGRH